MILWRSNEDVISNIIIAVTTVDVACYEFLYITSKSEKVAQIFREVAMSPFLPRREKVSKRLTES